MKKAFLSLLGGILMGGLISYLFLEYKDSNYEIRNYYGIDSKIVKEWDFEFISNVGFIVFGVSILIFLIWTFVEKKFKRKTGH
jgi:hypothetical protein